MRRWLVLFLIVPCIAAADTYPPQTGIDVLHFDERSRALLRDERRRTRSASMVEKVRMLTSLRDLTISPATFFGGFGCSAQ